MNQDNTTNPPMDSEISAAERVYRETIGSTVIVRTVKGHGHDIAVSTHDGEGSGVVVGDNLVATNCHVVDSGGEIFVLPANTSHMRNAPIKAKIVAASNSDMCLLETKGLSLPPVKIGAAKTLQIGHPVYAIGVPQYLGGTLTNGIVSRLWNSPNDTHALPGPLIQTNTEISPGSSGGGLFDVEGRLVGITTFGREHLNFAIPAELIGQLNERKENEKTIRLAIEKCTEFTNSAVPMQFSPMQLAMAVVESMSGANRLTTLMRMGDYDGALGSGKLAQWVTRHLAKFAEKESLPSDLRDLLTMYAAATQSCVGIEDIDHAIQMIEGINNKIIRATGYAYVASNCARHEGKPFQKAHEIRGQIKDIPDLQKAFGTNAQMFQNFVVALIGANAAMHDSEDALMLTDQYIDETESADHFLLYVEALAEIAATLKKQEVTIGSAAIFHYAMHAATKFRSRGVGTPERLVAFGTIAVYGAKCGYNSVAEAAFHAIGHLQQKGSISDIAADRIPNVSYRRVIEARGLEATARIIMGTPPEMHKALICLKCIPVLDHTAIPLACAAIIAQNKQEEENKED